MAKIYNETLLSKLLDDLTYYTSEITKEQMDYAGRAIYKGRVLRYIQTGEGRIAYNSSNKTYSWQYDIKDHLGNTRAVVAQTKEGQPTVLQQTHYYPFGLEMPGMGVGSTREEQPYLYNGKESINDLDLGWYDYGWRFYDPAIARWHVPDPLAENTYSLTPYRYAQNNPISIFDIAGLSDYFDANGNYYGTDNTDDDYVRIISQENWDNIQVTDEDGNVSVNVEQGMELSSAFSEVTDMSEDATLSVYDHYNPTDLDLKAKENETGAAGLTFHAEKRGNTTSERIDVKIEGNRDKKVADHANEITNMFTHEEQHYNDYKALGFDGYRNTPLDRRESRAVSTQMEHGSFSGTRPGYQRAIRGYGESFGMLFPLQPIPAVVIPSNN